MSDDRNTTDHKKQDIPDVSSKNANINFIGPKPFLDVSEGQFKMNFKTGKQISLWQKIP